MVTAKLFCVIVFAYAKIWFSHDAAQTIVEKSLPVPILILYPFQEPLSRVILLLDLMRTFSHFDSNMATMARHQVAATVVGCMSVYCDVVEVQAYGLDTLAKIAKFRPAIDKKV